MLGTLLSPPLHAALIINDDDHTVPRNLIVLLRIGPRGLSTRLLSWNDTFGGTDQRSYGPSGTARCELGHKVDQSTRKRSIRLLIP